ncbi:hypothetical protein GCM10023195_29150 [Actinoallomurus liliacearum]|uniref:Uncharacterized protein n=1 Tax=Actinoallomurus liliacearum TaxID=1080073 RepID=A0ABP8TGD5_9ACTN
MVMDPSNRVEAASGHFQMTGRGPDRDGPVEQTNGPGSFRWCAVSRSGAVGLGRDEVLEQRLADGAELQDLFG